MASHRNISLNGRNGIIQKRDALSAYLSKKHRGMIDFVGQVRNAADHGADPEEGNQTWSVSRETAMLFPAVVAILIKDLFSREYSASIEV